MTQTVSVSEQVLQLLRDGQRKEQVEAELLKQGHEERFVKEIVEETIKLRNSKARSLGLGLILVGALLCFTSCLITITAPSLSHTGYQWGLYGLTSLGIVIAFAGLVKIF